jgi:hypothetical protein
LRAVELENTPEAAFADKYSPIASSMVIERDGLKIGV